MFKAFPIYRQLDQMDCGPTCLRMISKYYGKHYSLQTLRDASYITRNGVSLKGISEAAERIGFRTLGAKLSFEQLDSEVKLPCILFWNQNHFVVLPPQNYDSGNSKEMIQIADPAIGLVRIPKDVFLRAWKLKGRSYGYALLLEPTPSFYKRDSEEEKRRTLSFLFKYLRPYKKYVVQLFAGMLISSLLSLLAPFLAQNMIDRGINVGDYNLIYLILLAQLFLFFGTTAIELVRGWILLHVSSRVNISIISDFLIKLMKLPIRFFDTKMVGDITQRISDHSRIEQFLTGASLNTLFSVVSMTVFLVVLAIYSGTIFLIFLIGSTLSILWILYFLRKRRDIDYLRFQTLSENRNNLNEIITGMQEIKLNDGETLHRWEWQRTQAKLFKTNIKGLSIAQYQNLGSGFFNQLKNILITFFAAKLVIDESLTIGMMLSISYITGMLNSPISQLLSFFQNAQDAKISLERLSEINEMKNEEADTDIIPSESFLVSNASVGTNGMEHKGIVLENVSFRYGTPGSPFVIQDLNLTIPLGMTTAIVGSSGSGKTTLMKLLLKFYEPTEGQVLLNSTPLSSISAKWWRSQCGVVMADGFIFSDTVERNITVHEDTDMKRLEYSIKAACLESFIDSLPLKIKTKIGNTGNGISSGQKQRILIARAIYRNPQFVFLDEATSTLDANNEREIIENLDHFYKGKTVVIIAHRLSTVRNADQILVLEGGKIVEVGSHRDLSVQRGKYYQLVRNQLEL